jgi:hypothetical protein
MATLINHFWRCVPPTKIDLNEIGDRNSPVTKQTITQKTSSLKLFGLKMHV